MYCPCGPDDVGSLKRTFEEIESEGSAELVTTRELIIQMLRDHADAFKAEVPASQAADLKHNHWARQEFYD